MKWWKDKYLAEIEAYKQTLRRCGSPLSAPAKRRIWGKIATEIQLSAAADPDITMEEQEEIYNVLNR